MGTRRRLLDSIDREIVRTLYRFRRPMSSNAIHRETNHARLTVKKHLEHMAIQKVVIEEKQKRFRLNEAMLR